TNLGFIDLTCVNAATEARLDVNGGTLVNAVGGTIRSSAAAGGNRALNAQLDNQGALEVQQSISIGNSGRMFTSTAGAVEVQSGKTLTVSGGSSTLGAGSVLTGGGVLDLAGSHT